MANARLKQLLNDLREAERDARQSDYRAVRNAMLAAVTDAALMTADDVYDEQYLWARAWRAELAMLLGS